MEIIDATCEALGRAAHYLAKRAGIFKSLSLSHGSYVVVGYFIVAVLAATLFFIWGVFNA